jgi:dTDP-4-amino-4,6-dideoxygalactose transaminase
MAIPILDLQEQYRTIRDEIDDAIQGVLERGDFILGPNVEALEQEVAQYCGCTYGVGVASGTDALRLAMDALEIGPGDEVITTTFTFIAPANVVSRAGATPVLVDIDPRTFNLDPIMVEAAITEHTKAILPVHLYGHAADMEALMELAVRYRLPVVEDSAQALGAEYSGQRVCSFGVMGCLSFFPTKNLGAYGDAGMVVTCNPDMADRLGVLRQHGRRTRNHHQQLGYNSRLDELQAAVLRVKLRHLETWNARRRGIAAYYDELWAGLPVTTPHEAPDARHVYQQYTIRAPRRDELQASLQARGIGTRVFYPLPVHLQEIYADLGLEKGTYPNAERAGGEVLSLPVYPELRDEQVEEVVAAIREFYGA